MRGAWDSAFVALDQAWAARPSIALARVRATLGATAFFVGATSENVAIEQRRGLAEFRAPPAATSAQRRSLAFVDGTIAYTARRPADLDSARARLRALTGDESAAFLERELGALALDLGGRHAEAGDSLAVIERERGGASSFDYDPVPMIRLAAGRLHASAGRAAAADSLFSYYESGMPSVPVQIMLKATAGLAAFERAKAWDRAGDAARASRFYREFLRLYDLPTQAHRHLVDEATSALARLNRR